MAQNLLNKSAKLLTLLPSRPVSRQSVAQKSSICDKFNAAKVDPNWAELDSCNGLRKQNRLDESMPARKNHTKPYQKHWQDFPELKAKKIYTCADMPAEPKPKRRLRSEHKPLTTCRQPLPSKRASICVKSKIDTCPRIQMPGCSVCRQPTVCIKHKKPIECCKIEAPVPSFYECIKKLSPPIKIKDKCLVRDTVCPDGSQQLKIATK